MAGNDKVYTAFTGFKPRRAMRFARVATSLEPLLLEQGGVLEEVWVAYETYGALNAQRDNVILVAHALTGDSHPARHDAADEEGWWEDLVGPGKPIDTNQFFIVCANVLGGCQGTTGPASLDPATGRPYAGRFPTVTIRDMVRVQRRLLTHLNIDRLVLVIGGSMGGMQALEWAIMYPEVMRGAAVIAAPSYTTAQAIAYNDIGRRAIYMDSHWQGGEYYGQSPPTRGLALARAVGMITYQSDPSMMHKFGRRMRQSRFEVEHYLDYQGEALVRRFDANSYLCLLRALDLHDIGYGRPSYEAALARIRARLMVVGVSSDILYPPAQQRELVETARRQGVAASYAEIDSPHGHDGFLIDFHLLRPVLHDFIEQIAPVHRPWASSLFKASRLAYLGA